MSRANNAARELRNHKARMKRPRPYPCDECGEPAFWVHGGSSIERKGPDTVALCNEHAPGDAVVTMIGFSVTARYLGGEL